jgi:hypothetical protein
MLVGLDLAAAHPGHLAAVAMHGTAARALFPIHRAARHARQQRRRGTKQQEDRDKRRKTAHMPQV